MKLVINNNTGLQREQVFILLLFCVVNYPRIYKDAPEHFKWIKKFNYCDIDYLIYRRKNKHTEVYTIEYDRGQEE